MDQSFGARLRTHREQQQVTLDAISAETKIKLSMLEALERDDVSQWPEGIFRRAYVRAYARAVGLDPETLVREFLDIHPDPVVTRIDAHTELENPQWPSGLRRLVTSAMAAVPSRRRRVNGAVAEPVQTELNLPPIAEAAIVDEERFDPASELSAVADDDGRLVRDDSAAEPRPEPSLVAAAELCAKLAQVADIGDVASILEEAVMVLDAVGLIVWLWDSRAAALRPSLACGYTEAALARMPRVRADADNAIAAAFQSGRASVVDGASGLTGAVVAPLIAHNGCVGVLAAEFRHGEEQRTSVRAFAAILAAQLVAHVPSAPLAEAVNA